MAQEFDLTGLEGALGVKPRKSEPPSQTATTPAPLRTNNPGALMPKGQLAQFGTMDEGLRALDQNLQAYGKRGINTLEGVINTWSPPTGKGNTPEGTRNYINHVARVTGLKPDQPIDLSNPLVRLQLTAGITQFESGPGAIYGQRAPAPAAAPAAAAGSTGEFDLGGLERALKGAPEPASTAAAPSAAPSATPTPTTAAPSKPPVPRMFESQTEFGKKLQSAIESIPGSAEIGTFANVAGGTVSKSIGAVQQLVGKYFPGLDESTRQNIMANAQQNIELANQAMEQAGRKESPKAAIAGEITGYVVNPLNKLIPTFGAAPTTIKGAAAKAAGQGAVANVLMTPVEDQQASFTTEKLKQAATGATFGAGGGAAIQMFSTTAGRGIDAVRKRFGGAVPANQLDDAANTVLREAGLDPNTIAPQYFKGLQDQAKTALQTGDIKTFQQFARNFSEANELGIPMLRGQLTRDPMQFAVEQNLRGIQGVGEPIQQVLQAQNKALLSKLDDFGAAKGQSITTSGFTLSNALGQADEVAAQRVRDAYAAYRQSTGRNIDVPLTGLAQDYARVLRDFGKDQIPGGVRNNLNSLGLLSGKQLKVTTIDDAERLIKVINNNYDPSKQSKGTLNALDELRRSLNNAINEAGANLPGQAGAAAREARKIAQERFQTIDSIPALKDAIRGKEPDKWVTKHILQGNVNEIDKMQKYLQANNPEALAQVQNDIIKHIKNRVTNNVSDENAAFSQAGLKDFVKGPMADRLQRFLTPEQFSNLTKLNRVAENALVAPVAAAVNRSNTAPAAANFVKGVVQSGEINNLLATIAGWNFPLLTGAAVAVQQRVQQRKASDLLRQATEPTVVPPPPRKTIPITDMVRPGVVGAGAGQAVIEQRNVETEGRR